jgi:hypothetical protein
LCLSTVCRLPKSCAAQQRYVPCQASTLLAVRRMRPRKLSDVPSQSHGSSHRRRTRRRVSAVCKPWTTVRRMQAPNARPPAFTRLVPRVCLSAMCSWLWDTAPEQKHRRPGQIPCQTPAGVDRPNAVRSKWTTQQTPCHRCRRRRSHRNIMPARRCPLANPKKENHLARPPPRSVAQRLQRLTVHPHLQQFLLANRKKDVRPAPARVFPCQQKSRKPCTSKSPSQFPGATGETDTEFIQHQPHNVLASVHLYDRSPT